MSSSAMAASHPRFSTHEVLENAIIDRLSQFLEIIDFQQVGRYDEL